MPIRTLATLGLFTVLLSSPALAQNDGTDRPGRNGDAAGRRGGDPEMIVNRMMRADTDQDGRISKEEATSGKGNGRLFTQADADGDGFADMDTLDWRQELRREIAALKRPSKVWRLIGLGQLCVELFA